MQYEFKPYNYSPTDEEIIKDLQKVAKSLNTSKLTIKDYKEHGGFDESTIRRRFGSWNNALVKAEISVTQQFWTNEQLFENLENAWRIKGAQPCRRDMDNKAMSFISSGAYLRKFGKWSDAIKAFIDYINQDDNSQLPSAAVETIINAAHSHKTKRDINLRLRFKVLQRDHFKCCTCGASPAKDPSVILHVDHIKPWAKGGETVIENLQTLCSDCNRGKSDLY